MSRKTRFRLVWALWPRQDCDELTGSRSQEILTGGFDRLSTYGILKDQGSGCVDSLLRALSDAGLLRVEVGDYPCLRLIHAARR